MTGFATGASTLFSRHTPGGVFTIQDIRQVPGNLIFVDSTNGADTNSGKSPDSAMATLDAAIGKCTANQGDVILVAPGHAETLVGATSCVLDVAGVTIIGLGEGTVRPTFTLGTDTAATISVTAANGRIENCRIISDLADVAAGITAAAGADGLHVRGCYFSDGGAAKELVIGISLAAGCDFCVIEDNEFYTVAGGGCASAIKLVGASNRTIIRRNISIGDYSAANIDGATAAGTLLTIDGNILQNVDSTAGLCASMHASTTGLFVNNRGQGAKTNTRPFSVAGMMVAENYGSAAVNESGAIDPAVETFA